jgi:hypothetical protein
MPDEPKSSSIGISYSDTVTALSVKLSVFCPLIASTSTAKVCDGCATIFGDFDWGGHSRKYMYFLINLVAEEGLEPPTRGL